MWSSLGKQNVQVKEVDGIRDKVMPGVREQEGTAFKDLCHSEFEFFFIFNFYFKTKLENTKHFLDMPAVSKSWSSGQCLRLFENKILQRKYLLEQKIKILHEFTD